MRIGIEIVHKTGNKAIQKKQLWVNKTTWL